jgi:tetratricopeptide (TPR) repeat protein
MWIAVGLSVVTVLAIWRFWAIQKASLLPETIWEQAQENFKAGRYAQVEAGLAHLGRLRAPTAEDWSLRAQLALARKQAAEAIACLDHIPDGHSLAAHARLLAGQAERQRNRLRVAEEALRAAVRLDPSLVQAHRALIYIYGMQLRRGEIDSEFLALQKLTRLSYEDAYHWTSLLNNLWEPGDVIADLIRFVAADPNDRWSRLALAGILRRMGLHDQAQSTLTSLPPGDREADEIRIQIALDRQENEKAETLLARGRSDDPAFARLRGRQALVRRDARSAVQHFRIAHAADHDDHEALFGLRTALELLGDEIAVEPIREAARTLDRLNTLLQRAAAGEAGRNPDLFRQLGIACADLGRLGEARAWLEVAIARNPLDSEAQQALFRLRGAARSVNQSPARTSWGGRRTGFRQPSSKPRPTA